MLAAFVAAAVLAQESGGDIPGVPRVLIVGDSISEGYTWPLTRLTLGKCNVHHIPGDGGSTSNGVAKIDEWLGKSHWDIIVFNFGLEDMRLDENGRHLVEIPQYEANLKVIADKLSKTGASLLWVDTTPVPAGNLNPPRRHEDVAEYNRAAKRALERTPHRTCDLYLADLFRQKGDIHFTPAGYDRLAKLVSLYIVYQYGECIMDQ